MPGPVHSDVYIWTSSRVLYGHSGLLTLHPFLSMSKQTVEFDYNTQRPRLIIPEYGRHVQRMVEHCMTIEDRAERTRVARAIIAVIGRLSPMLRNGEDGDHALWDHLYIMSDFKLDVDGPFPKPSPEELESKPDRLTYPKQRIRFGHYGKIVERFIATVAAMPDGPEKDNAVLAIGNLMKRQFLAWNRDSVGDEVIIKDLKELSAGELRLKDDVVLANTADLLRAHSAGPRNDVSFERGGGKRRNKRNRNRGKKRY